MNSNLNLLLENKPVIFHIKISLFFFFFACYTNNVFSQYFYIPDNDTNIVQAKELNDFQLGIAAPLKNRINIQLTYSPINYVSFSGGFYKHQQKEENSLSGSTLTEGISYSGSIGLYRYLHKLDKHNFLLTRKLKGVLIFANLGYSNGKISNTISSLYETNLSHQTIFFRSGITLEYRFLSFTFSTRYLRLDFRKGDVTGNPAEFNWFISRLNQDVESRDPRNLKETFFRIKYLAKPFELYVDVNTIRGKKDRNLRSSFFILETYNFGILVKLDQLLGLKK